MKIVSYLLLPIVLALIAIPVLAVIALPYQLFQFAVLQDRDVFGEGQMAILCTWTMLASVEWLLLRSFAKEPNSISSVLWFAGFSVVATTLLCLIAVVLADSFHWTLGEFGIGVVFLVIGATGIAAAGIWWQLRRYVIGAALAE